MTLDGENELARHPLTGGRTLVWRDDGSPYDNTLQVYVLAADGSIIDALEAGAAFTTSLLAFRREGPEVFDFSFFANDRIYRLQVDREPSLRIPVKSAVGFPLQVGIWTSCPLGDDAENIDDAMSSMPRADGPVSEALRRGWTRPIDRSSGVTRWAAPSVVR